MNVVPTPEANELTFVYRNWKGHIAERRVKDFKLVYNDNPYHNGPQWFLKGIDVDKNVMRDFALTDILTPLRQTQVIVNPCNYKEAPDVE